MDVIYQFVALKKLYPFEVVLVAFILAIIPYLLIRGPVGPAIAADNGPGPDPLVSLQEQPVLWTGHRDGTVTTGATEVCPVSARENRIIRNVNVRLLERSVSSIQYQEPL